MAQLREEGYLESRHGSGSRVILPEHIRHVPTRTSTGTALDLSTAALSAGPKFIRLTNKRYLRCRSIC
jgi:DNA-binding GntR family transcriptional regulator